MAFYFICVLVKCFYFFNICELPLLLLLLLLRLVLLLSDQREFLVNYSGPLRRWRRFLGNYNGPQKLWREFLVNYSGPLRPGREFLENYNRPLRRWRRRLLGNYSGPPLGSLGLLLRSLGFSLALLGSLGLSWVLLGSLVLLGSPGLYWALQARFHRFPIFFPRQVMDELLIFLVTPQMKAIYGQAQSCTK